MRTDADAEVVAVVGVGRMGGAFAGRLLAAGHRVVAVDTDAARSAQAAERGGIVAGDVDALAEHHPAVVLLSLPTEASFATVVDQLASALASASASAGWAPVVVDTGTFSLVAKHGAADRLAAAGLTLLDCPVSGTSGMAEAGDVVVYASGPTDAVERCRPVLAAFARSIHHVGPFGAGSTLKFLANLLVGVHTAAAAEVLALARRAGLDPAAVLGLLTDGAGTSRMLEVRGPSMASGDYGDAATIDLFRKDLAIIADFAAAVGATTPLLARVTDLLARAAHAGLVDADIAAVHRLYLDGDLEP